MTITRAVDLVEAAQASGRTLGQVVLAHEAKVQSKTETEIRAEMLRVLEVMRDSAAKGAVGTRRSLGGLVGGEAARYERYISEGRSLAGTTIARASMMALAVAEVNASMGRIVAAPTAGSCGILPGALLAVGERLKATDEALVDALFASAGIGMIIARNATIAGAEGGCQAECGAACSMAAAACAHLAGADPSTCLEAAALALKNELGLACDPVAGLVEVPCAKRNALKAAEAVVAADMALAGIKSVIPFDEVVDAMRQIGNLMPPSLKETAEAGLAATKTGIELKKRILGNSPVTPAGSA